MSRLALGGARLLLPCLRLLYAFPSQRFFHYPASSLAAAADSQDYSARCPLSRVLRFANLLGHASCFRALCLTATIYHVRLIRSWRCLALLFPARAVTCCFRAGFKYSLSACLTHSPALAARGAYHAIERVPINRCACVGVGYDTLPAPHYRSSCVRCSAPGHDFLPPVGLTVPPTACAADLTSKALRKRRLMARPAACMLAPAAARSFQKSPACSPQLLLLIHSSSNPRGHPL